MSIKNLIYLPAVWLLVFITACSTPEGKETAGKKQAAYGKSVLQEQLDRLDPSGALSRKVKIITNTDPSLNNEEAFRLLMSGDTVRVTGGSGKGVLYGCLDAGEFIRKHHGLPEKLSKQETPAIPWRGLSLQLMKLGEYNYAITPEEFPFFYDKGLWIAFMDFMARERFNYIILWNGHPFDYFVKFDKYPEAQAGMTDEQIRQNHDMLRWLIHEGAKRNIKIFFEFYNIHTSVFYQQAHHLPKELSVPTPELEAYTKYSISRFVHEFPEAGLFVTPGEGLERKYSSSWINGVIFPAIRSTGFTPTVFMRAWFFDLEHARQIVDNYPDLWFVRKFNVEMIADTIPDPENKAWAALNGHFIVNVHLAANLEPFRWNPPSYIRAIVKNCIAGGATGIHLHPRKAWRWPYGSDKGLKETQWQRDTLFFTAWSRYAWNPRRNQKEDYAYWLRLLTERYGTQESAQHFLNSFEAGADVLPGLQRLIWLGYDNHTIVSAGATMMQLLHSKGIPFLSIKPVLRISEYIQCLKTGKEPEGITPIAFTSQKIREAEDALQEAKKAYSVITKHRDEAARIVSDAEAVLQTARYYHDKLLALKSWVLLDQDAEPAQNSKLFIRYLTASVNDFAQLCTITVPVYESMSDVPAKHPVTLKKVPYHWQDLFPLYKKELEIYKKELLTEKGPGFYQPALPGLAGIFYSEPAFIDAEKSYPARTLDFDWNGNQEIGKHWSVEWFGFLRSPVTGTMNLTLSADRDVKMFFAGDTLIFSRASSGEKTAGFTLEKNGYYPVKILYDHQNGEGGFLRVEWSWQDHPREVIPGDHLFHSQAQSKKIMLLTELIKELQ